MTTSTSRSSASQSNFNKIEYHVDKATILSSVVVVMGSETNRNETNADQTIDLTFSKTESVSYTWDYTVAFTIGVEAGEEVEIPFVADGHVTTNLSNTHSFSSAHTTSDDTTFAGTVTATAPPYTKVTATATMTRSSISVPFTMYGTVASDNASVAINGIYTGTSFWNFEANFKEAKHPEQ